MKKLAWILICKWEYYLDKTLLIVIDDFSDRVASYENVTLFDYSSVSQITYIDNFYNVYDGSYSGYLNYDDFVIDEGPYPADFFPISVDNETSP